MRVPGQLQMVTGLRGSKCRAGLVRKQHFDGLLRGTHDGLGRITAVTRIEMMRVEVSHPGDNDGLPLMNEHDVLVHQHAEAKTPQLRYPGVHSGIVLMISSDKKHPMARTQSPHGFRMSGKTLNATVDQVAGYGNHVGLQRIHRIDNPVYISALDGGANMNIGDLRNAEAMQRRRQAIDRHIDSPDSGPPPRVDETDEG